MNRLQVLQFNLAGDKVLGAGDTFNANDWPFGAYGFEVDDSGATLTSIKRKSDYQGDFTTFALTGGKAYFMQFTEMTVNSGNIRVFFNPRPNIN